MYTHPQDPRFGVEAFRTAEALNSQILIHPPNAVVWFSPGPVAARGFSTKHIVVSARGQYLVVLTNLCLPFMLLLKYF